MLPWRKIAVFMLALILLPGLLFAGGCGAAREAAPEQAGSQEKVSDAALPGVGPDTIADIVAQAGPAVVKINTLVQVGGDGRESPFSNDPFFRQFFGLNSQPQYQNGLGSGFIISKDGYILTNDHVVEGAENITVVVKGDKKTYSGKLVGLDPALDLAVIKIDGKEFPTLPLGDSDQIRVGNWVIAIGSPFGLEDTVTIGVISAKERPVEIDNRSFDNLLQTDASINPGNSGGPLLNLKGEVVGINTAINAEAQGIGFAVPANTVKEVLDELIKEGKVRRAWLGVQIQPVTPDVAEYLNYNSSEGAVIGGVVSGGPASKAGLKAGDIITAIDGTKIATPDELIKTIQKKKIGTQVEIEVFRQGETIKIKITTMERPADVN